MFLALLLACGPPTLTFDQGGCVDRDPCHVPLGANLPFAPLLGGEPPEKIFVDSSDVKVLAEGESRNDALALFRTVSPGTATATITAWTGGEKVSRSFPIEVHAIADLGLKPPADGVRANDSAVWTVSPRAADGTELVSDWLWIAESEMLCLPSGCRHSLPDGTHRLWNGTEAEPVVVTPR